MGLLRSALPGLAEAAPCFWGDRDRAVGLASRASSSSILPNRSLLVVPGAGHLAFEEMPEICNQAMRDWLLALRSPMRAIRCIRSARPSGRPRPHLRDQRAA